MDDGVWVISGPGMPCGARALGPAGGGRVWYDVCILGQHLPQMYRPDDVTDLTPERCPALGLCPDCLGFGDLDPGPAAGMLEAARGVDQITRPCPGCGGTGRPAIRVTIVRSASGVQGSMRPVPHAYVPPLPFDPQLRAAFGAPDDMCLGCGMPAAGTGPHGEQLHPDAGVEAAGLGREDDRCPSCTCCAEAGCHRGPDSECPYSENTLSYLCPCTED